MLVTFSATQGAFLLPQSLQLFTISHSDIAVDGNHVPLSKSVLCLNNYAQDGHWLSFLKIVSLTRRLTRPSVLIQVSSPHSRCSMRLTARPLRKTIFKHHIYELILYQGKMGCASPHIRRISSILERNVLYYHNMACYIQERGLEIINFGAFRHWMLMLG